MTTTNYQSMFLDKIESMVLSLGGTVPAMAQTTNFEERSMQLLDALGSNLGNSSGSSYIRLDPRVEEWDRVDVSDIGQNYTLASIPQSGRCLVHLIGSPGRNGGTTLRISFAGPDEVKPLMESVQTVYYEYYLSSLTSYSVGVQPHHLLVPALDGQIWAKRTGVYSDVNAKTKLWALGYWPL